MIFFRKVKLGVEDRRKAGGKQTSSKFCLDKWFLVGRMKTSMIYHTFQFHRGSVSWLWVWELGFSYPKNQRLDPPTKRGLKESVWCRIRLDLQSPLGTWDPGWFLGNVLFILVTTGNTWVFTGSKVDRKLRNRNGGNFQVVSFWGGGWIFYFGILPCNSRGNRRHLIGICFRSSLFYSKHRGQSRNESIKMAQDDFSHSSVVQWNMAIS